MKERYKKNCGFIVLTNYEKREREHELKAFM